MTVVRRCQALWQLFVWQGQGVYASVWKRNNESFRIKLFFERKGPKFVWPWLSWICVNNKLMVHHHPKQIFKPRNLFSFFGLTHLAIIGKTHTKWTLHNVLLCTTWYVLKPPIAIECSEVMSAEWICECVQVFVWRGGQGVRIHQETYPTDYCWRTSFECLPKLLLLTLTQTQKANQVQASTQANCSTVFGLILIKCKKKRHFSLSLWKTVLRGEWEKGETDTYNKCNSVSSSVGALN